MNAGQPTAFTMGLMLMRLTLGRSAGTDSIASLQALRVRVFDAPLSTQILIQFIFHVRCGIKVAVRQSFHTWF